jgi:Amt family ammonium transporter
MPDLQTYSLVLFNLLAFLVPVGLSLLAIGAASEERAGQVAATALLALATAGIGYFVCGFAFQFGGAAFVSGMPGLQSLTAEWSPVDLTWGSGWGVIGLRGFFLLGEAYNADVYLLFLYAMPAVTTSVLVTLLALSKHVGQTCLVAIGLLISGFIYPLVGNWVWGGGWLANLGLNLELGHGFVDAAGSGTVFLLGSLVALSMLLLIKPRRAADDGPATLPPIHFPVLMISGTLLALVGWTGLVLGNPLAREQIVAPLSVVNLMLAAAAAALVVSLYSWFVTGRPDALATGRGAVAGLVAASAACAFIPAWAALATGAIAGALLLVGLYMWEQVLHWDEPSASAAVFALPGSWGLVALAIFADGRWGAGWNNVGVSEYLGIPGQGISGSLLASGYQMAEGVQLRAQVIGLVALLVIGLLVPWMFFRFVLWLRALGQSAPALSPAPHSVLGETAGEGMAEETPGELEGAEKAADAGGEEEQAVVEAHDGGGE